MHLRQPEALTESIPSYTWFVYNEDVTKKLHGHKSFWIQRQVNPFAKYNMFLIEELMGSVQKLYSKLHPIVISYNLSAGSKF